MNKEIKLLMDIFRLLILILVMPILGKGQTIDYNSTFHNQEQQIRVQSIQLENYKSVLRISNKKSILLSDTLEYFIGLQLIDFNRNGLTDVLINHPGNVDRQQLYLSMSNGDFRKVEGFIQIPQCKSRTGRRR